MQRTEDGGIVISCDFCGTDWDQLLPMVEGHRGSVLCLECLKQALDQALHTADEIECTVCLAKRRPAARVWTHPRPRPSRGLKPAAVVCWSCIRQAATRLAKDEEVDFHWDPAAYPRD